MYNQYNPWQTAMPNSIPNSMPNYMPKTGHNFNWNNILNNTQKTLGIINQAIPLVYQMRPLISNAKTLFRIAGVMKEDQEEQEDVTAQANNNTFQEENRKEDSNSLHFFI